MQPQNCGNPKTTQHSQEQKLNGLFFQNNLAPLTNNSWRGGATGNSDDNSSLDFKMDELDEDSSDTTSSCDSDNDE